MARAATPTRTSRAAQTQVTGIDQRGDTVGFWVDAAGDNFGFVDRNGRFTDVVVNGVNDLGQLVGFYLDKNGNTDGMLAIPSH